MSVDRLLHDIGANEVDALMRALQSPNIQLDQRTAALMRHACIQAWLLGAEFGALATTRQGVRKLMEDFG